MKLIPLLVLGAMTWSCKKEEEKSAANESPATETDATDATDPVDQTQAGEVALAFDENTTPARALDTLAASLAAIPESELGAQLITPGTVAVSLLDSGYSDGECDGNGYPVAKSGEDADSSGVLKASSTQYPQRHFYCQVKVGTSPETLLGSITINKGVLCALEKAGAMAEDKLGQEQQISAKIDTECFSAEFIEAMNNEDNGDDGGEAEGGGDSASLTEYASAGEFPMTVKVEKLTGHANWDLSITMQMKSDDKPEGKDIYYFRNTSSYLSGARVDEAPDGTYGPGYVFSVTTDGKIRFENRLGPSKGSGFTGSQHIRMLVEGTFDPETKRIKSVSRYEGASANLPQETSGSIVTIKGTLEGGFRTKGYSCPKPDATPQSSCWSFENFGKTADVCVGKEKCDGNDGINLTAETFKFLLPGAASENVFMPAFLEKVKLPLAFDSVTLEDIP